MPYHLLLTEGTIVLQAYYSHDLISQVNQTARQRLAAKTSALQKALAIGELMLGKPTTQVFDANTYLKLPRRVFEEGVSAFPNSITRVFSPLLVTAEDALQETAIRWLAGRYDEFVLSGAGVFAVANVLDFEQNVGTLLASIKLDIPPYAEVLVMPGVSVVAYRHPEYMLARDTEYLYGQFLKTEEHFYLNTYGLQIGELRILQRTT